MGLKDFLFEKTENDDAVNMVTYDMEPVVAEVELSSVNADTLIEDIYAQNGLMDKSKSIFKVEELINSLPKEMVTSTKKASVSAILGSFGLTVTSVIADGEQRMNVLAEINQQLGDSCVATVTKKEAEIEELKKKIADLQAEIAMELEVNKASSEAILAEVKRVEDLVEFIGGTK